MKDNLTEIVFILDESGSMSRLTDDTIGGYNSFVKEQKNQSGEAYLTTVLFDDRYIVLHDHINIHEVPELTWQEYKPLGLTALMDAIGRTINNVGERLANTPEEDRPSHVVFVITTDGCENASQEYTKEKVKEMIEHQQTKYSWEFMFLGAGIDAYEEAASIGLNNAHVMSVASSSDGINNMYASVTYATNAVRSCATLDSLGDSWKTGDVGK